MTTISATWNIETLPSRGVLSERLFGAEGRYRSEQEILTAPERSLPKNEAMREQSVTTAEAQAGW